MKPDPRKKANAERPLVQGVDWHGWAYKGPERNWALGFNAYDYEPPSIGLEGKFVRVKFVEVT